MHIAESVPREKGILKKKCISHGWWSQFIECQGDLSLRRGHVRMDATNKDTMKQYFSLLKEVLDEFDCFHIQLKFIMSMRVAFHLITKPLILLLRLGPREFVIGSLARRGRFYSTVVICASAVGQALPPMIIFDAQNLNHAWTKDEVPGTRYNGWINTDLFEGWLVEHFIQYAVPGRPP